MTEYFLIYPQGKSNYEPYIVGVELKDTEELLSFLYDTIRCSSIENVYLRNHPGLIAVVDEEGLFRDNKLNWIISAIYGGRIMGVAVVGQQGERDGEPDFVGFASKDEAYQVSRRIYNDYMKGR